MYKYRDIPEGIEVIFIKAIKTPHWVGEPERIGGCGTIPVGGISWIEKSSEGWIGREGCSIYPEDNRHHINFDASCFEIVPHHVAYTEHTTPESEKMYRFKTKEEFAAEGRWFDYGGGSGEPEGWGGDMVNLYLGQPIDAKYNHFCEDKQGFTDDAGWYFKSEDYVLITTPKKIKAVAISEFRFKTEAEFKRDGEWNFVYGLPSGWGTDKRVLKFLGRIIPSEHNKACRNQQSITIEGFSFFGRTSYIHKHIEPYYGEDEAGGLKGSTNPCLEIGIGTWDEECILREPEPETITRDDDFSPMTDIN